MIVEKEGEISLFRQQNQEQEQGISSLNQITADLRVQLQALQKEKEQNEQKMEMRDVVERTWETEKAQMDRDLEAMKEEKSRLLSSQRLLQEKLKQIKMEFQQSQNIYKDQSKYLMQMKLKDMDTQKVVISKKQTQDELVQTEEDQVLQRSKKI